MGFIKKVEAANESIKVRSWNGYIRPDEHKFNIQEDIGGGGTIANIIKIGARIKEATSIFSSIPGVKFGEAEVIHSRMGILAVSIVATLPKNKDQFFPEIKRNQTLEQYSASLLEKTKAIE